MQYIGTISALLTTIAFLPQVTKTIKTKDVSGISLGMYLTYCLGVMLWTIYGILLQDFNLIFSSGITCIFSGVVLFLKLKAGRNPKDPVALMSELSNPTK